MSSTDSIEGMQESRAQAPEGVGPMATAMAAHRGATRSSFHLHLQGDRLGTIWGRVAAERSARQSVRIARTESDLEQMLVHTRRDEQALFGDAGLTDLADALADDRGAHAFRWSRTGPRG